MNTSTHSISQSIDSRRARLLRRSTLAVAVAGVTATDGRQQPGAQGRIGIHAHYPLNVRDLPGQ